MTNPAEYLSQNKLTRDFPGLAVAILMSEGRGLRIYP